MLKRLICILLAGVFLCGTVSCSRDTTSGQPSASDGTSGEPADTEDPFIITEDMLVFVQNNISEYTIVRPTDATVPNVKAAEELQSYLKQISGVEIPVKNDAEPVSEFEIAVGYTNRSTEGQFDAAKLGDDGFVIETVGKKLFIAGSGVRGALYGVYTFLEEYLGCRFYTSDFEKIPQRTVLCVQPIERDEQIPVFEYREIDYITSRKNNFHPKLKINGQYNNASPEYGGRVAYTGRGVHSLEEWVSVEKYFADHPEYFALNEDGTRQNKWGAQPCLSNPDVLNLVIEKVRSLLQENPDAKLISVSQPDSGAGHKPCMCTECKKIYEEEGAFSGAQIRFVNAVAAEFAEDYPNLQFDTLAYRHTRSVCKTAPAENVVVRFCTIECCFSHPLGSCKDIYAAADSIQSVSADIADWAKICNKLYVWDYVTDFQEPNSFFPNFNVLHSNVKFFADNHVVGLYEEGNYFSDTCDFPELRSYIMAKLLWNPYMTSEEYWALIDDFLKNYYGEGWTYIREYIDLCQSLVTDCHFGIYEKFSSTIYGHKIEKTANAYPSGLTLEMVRNYESVDWVPVLMYNVQESEAVTRGFELLDAAAAKASPEEAKRIGKLRLLPEFLRSVTLQDVIGERVLKDRIVAALFDFFDHSPEAKNLSSAEEGELLYAVRDYVCTHYANAYEEYNRALFLRAAEHGIYRFREGNPQITDANDERLHFENVPNQWIP